MDASSGLEDEGALSMSRAAAPCRGGLPTRLADGRELESAPVRPCGPLPQESRRWPTRWFPRSHAGRRGIRLHEVRIIPTRPALSNDDARLLCRIGLGPANQAAHPPRYVALAEDEKT